MIALYIIGGILLFIFLLLIMPLKIKISSTDEFRVFLYYGFLKFDLLKEKPEKKKKPKHLKQKSKSQKPEKEKEEKKGLLGRLCDEKGIIGAFGYIRDVYVRPILSEIGKLTRKVSIKPLYLNIVFSGAGKDAAAVALDYGKFCAAFYPALGIAENLITVKKQKINIGVDYTMQKNDIRFYLVLHTRLLHITASDLRLLFKIIIKSAGDKPAFDERNVCKNGRQYQKHNGNDHGQAQSNDDRRHNNR